MIIDYLIDDKQSNKNKNNRGVVAGEVLPVAILFNNVVSF